MNIFIIQYPNPKVIVTVNSCDTERELTTTVQKSRKLNKETEREIKKTIRRSDSNTQITAISIYIRKLSNF